MSEKHYHLLTLTPEIREKLCTIASEIIDLLTKKHNLGPMESYVILDMLRESLMSAVEIESVTKVKAPNDNQKPN